MSHVDITLIGGGIMSATLGMLFRIACPDASVAVFERLDGPGRESSDPWNNAGTGHAAHCELHYTPPLADGSIDLRKAMLVNEQFSLSLQFYSWLVEQGNIASPRSFITAVPHVAFAQGEADVAFLRRRHEAMSAEPPFANIAYSEDPDQIGRWLPLVMEGRNNAEAVTATWSGAGTDIDFGSLTGMLIDSLEQCGAEVSTGHEVTDLSRATDGQWNVTVKDLTSGEKRKLTSRFVFAGAGGAAIRLLQKSGIPQIRGFGGFPIGGQFLRCTNPGLIDRHDAKVYGRPAAGAPPMTAPHLDTRIIDGRRGLMFGPFAGFNTKFLKHGSWVDFFRSIRRDNIGTMLAVARDELPLTAYLIQQVLQTRPSRVRHLRQFMPAAGNDDWELIQSGQRVQIMRPTSTRRGVLQYGTEVITSSDGTMAGLLGASPGASTATAIMLDVMKRCFPQEFGAWQPALREAIPTLGTSLAAAPELYRELDQRAARVLQLDRQPAHAP